MDEDESLRPTNVTVDDRQQRISPYNLLMRQSRKMGHFATRTYDVTKEFLKKDVSTLNPVSPDRILFGKKFDTARAAKAAKEGSRTKKDKDDIKATVRKSHEILASVRTVILPMNLFPDSITVDRTKITITKRTFFWSEQVISLRVEDILNVSCSVGPLFGSVTVSTRVMNSTDHFEVNYLWRSDALYVKQLIQGYYIAQHNQIETQHLARDELIETLLELGSEGTTFIS